MNNTTRNIVKMIYEICNEQKINIQSFSDDWIFRLTKNNVSRHIFGYRFELNKAVVDSICNDKATTSEILLNNKIPCIEHYFFISPSNFKYINNDGNWNTIIKLLQQHKRIVCKPNEGTGGDNVILVNNQKELETAISKVFSKSRGLAIAPYYEIKNEYRIIVLNKQIKLMYLKVIPKIIGNGKDTILKILANSDKKYNFNELNNNINYYYIPLKGEIVNLNWKHNLGLGAVPKMITDSKLSKILSDMSLKTIDVLNIKFASIDVAEINGEYKVLEINSGVMMNYFASVNDENYNIAKNIYKEAIDLMFEE